MPIATFDGSAMIATLTTSGSLDVRQLYSDWLRWSAQHPEFLPFFDVVGGEVLDPVQGVYSPVYLRCINGARIRPMETDQTLEVTNGILMVEGGAASPFVPTIGNWNVEIVRSKPVEAISFATGGSGGVNYTLDQIAEAVWSRQTTTMTTEGSIGKWLTTKALTVTKFLGLK